MEVNDIVVICSSEIPDLSLLSLNECLYLCATNEKYQLVLFNTLNVKDAFNKNEALFEMYLCYKEDRILISYIIKYSVSFKVVDYRINDVKFDFNFAYLKGGSKK